MYTADGSSASAQPLGNVLANHTSNVHAVSMLHQHQQWPLTLYQRGHARCGGLPLLPPSPLLPPPPAGLLLLFGGWPLSPPEDDGWGSSLAAQHCGNLLCLYICALTASEACERGLTLGRQQQLGNSLVAAVVVCACMCSIKKSRYLLPVLTGHVAVCRLPNCMPCAHSTVADFKVNLADGRSSQYSNRICKSIQCHL